MMVLFTFSAFKHLWDDNTSRMGYAHPAYSNRRDGMSRIGACPACNWIGVDPGELVGRPKQADPNAAAPSSVGCQLEPQMVQRAGRANAGSRHWRAETRWRRMIAALRF